MERMPERIDSKFRYILLAAERAEMMMRGARPKLDTDNRKPPQVAMDEIVNDLVEWDFGPLADEEPADEAVEA